MRSGSFSSAIARGGRPSSPSRLERASNRLERALASSADSEVKRVADAKFAAIGADRERSPLLRRAASNTAHLNDLIEEKVALIRRTSGAASSTASSPAAAAGLAAAPPCPAAPLPVPAAAALLPDVRLPGPAPAQQAGDHSVISHPGATPTPTVTTTGVGASEDDVWLSSDEEPEVKVIKVKAGETTAELRETINSLERLHLAKTKEKISVEARLGDRIRSLERSHNLLVQEVTVKHQINQSLETKLMQLSPIVTRYSQLYQFLHSHHSSFYNLLEDVQRLQVENNRLQVQVTQTESISACHEAARVEARAEACKSKLELLNIKVQEATRRMANMDGSEDWDSAGEAVATLQRDIHHQTGKQDRLSSRLSRARQDQRRYNKALECLLEEQEMQSAAGFINPLYHHGGAGVPSWVDEAQRLLQPVEVPAGPVDFNSISGVHVAVSDVERQAEPGQHHQVEGNVAVQLEGERGGPTSHSAGPVPPLLQPGEVPQLPVLLPRQADPRQAD